MSVRFAHRSAAALVAGAVLLAGSAAGQASTAEERLASWQAHLALERASPFRDLVWRPIGPAQSGARVEAIAVPPGPTATIYVGVGSGNLWKSTNGGLTWTPIFEHESAFAIGDVAVAPSRPEVVWVGTGETQPRHSGYSYAGTGVFRSLDGGATWEHRGLADTHHIGKVLIDPRDPDVVLVAAIGHFWTPNRERGLFKTTDGGATWRQVLYVDERTGAIDVVRDPSDPRILYASTWETVSGEASVTGPGSGIHRSTDGGETWQRLGGGLPPGPLGRSGLAIAPSRPERVFAFVDNWAPWTPPANDTGDDGKENAEDERPRREIVGAELYRSDDRGLTWTKINRDDLYEVFGIYGWKFCDVRVAPDDPDELYILGNRAYRSSDGGRTFARIGEQIVRLNDTRGEVMHLDHHEIWLDPHQPGHVLLGNDGGLFESRDHGQTWLHLNTIPAAELYSISIDQTPPAPVVLEPAETEAEASGEPEAAEREVAPEKPLPGMEPPPYFVFGGTQDNAAIYGPSDAVLDGPLPDPWENVYLDRWTGGDSFDTYRDPTDPRIVYYEHQHGAMRRMDLTGGDVQSGGASATDIAPRAPEGSEPWRFGWYTPFVISHHNPLTLYAGGNVVLESLDRGDSWRAISPDLADVGGGERAVVPFGTITSIAESPQRPHTLWVATEGGSVHRTRNGGATWERCGPGLPEKWVNRVIVSSHDPNVLYVALDGYREDDFRAYVYRSDDGCDTWRSIRANLPDESVHVLREDPHTPKILYAGTDLGVYVSIDGAASWHSLSATLPTTPVHDLQLQAPRRELVAGTHGRSVWILDVEAVHAAAGVGEEE